jgi:hypothetical protein
MAVRYFMNRKITKEEALAGISNALVDAEYAIQHHPESTRSVYEEGKSEFLEGQEGVEHTEWSRTTGLTLPQLVTMHQYLLAASFMSAWYHIHWDKRRRDQAAQSACLIVSALGFNPLDVMRQLLTYEQAWRRAMRSAGIGLDRKFGCLIVIIFAIGVVLWLVFR